MNYLLEIREFYNSLEINEIGTNAIVLWHALMNVNNKCNWQGSFTVAIRTLELKTGLSKPAILRARNVLKQYKYIDFETKNNKAAVYKINSLQYLTDTASDTATNTASDTASDTAANTANGTINKPNKTKPNQTKNKTPIIPYGEIVEYFNGLSFPKVKELSEARKKNVRSFLKTHTIDDLYLLFETADSSKFLTGGNDKGWKANFDWILKPGNAVKILEGNYGDSEKKEGIKSNRFVNYTQREYDFDRIDDLIFEEIHGGKESV